MKTATSHIFIEQDPKKITYAGKKFVLATKHQKERAISHPFRRRLGAEVCVADVDTDTLGTFSGEVERVGSPEQAALKKAKWAVEKTGNPRGLGSEGSFGPHFAVPFANADHEILAFVDAEIGIQVIEQTVSFETNLGSIATLPGEDLNTFLQRIRFGTHGLVVRPNSGDTFSIMFKGICQFKELTKCIEECSKKSLDGKAYLETDMRAHFNPSRMRVIRRLAYQLANRLSNKCDRCQSPGWGFIDAKTGLPCEMCLEPTSLVSLEVFGCPRCKHNEVRKRADGKEFAEQKYCAECNP